ncbi:MAG: glycoside hydrolase family 3 C-terminal domain-containing protein [Saprospiraceae bacterium]|nr:glycoside hydrolase family 3 C-terminal domain-containing protein [Saprospiraceae bacterium]
MSKNIFFISGLLLLKITMVIAQVKNGKPAFPRSQGSSSVMLVEGGRFYRDLNKNNKLDIYEDIQQSIDARIEDLIAQMTLEEKAGMMFMNGAPVSEDADPQGRVNLTGPAARMASVVENMNALKMTHFNIWDIPADPSIFARWYNRTQEAAEKTRLGIPITIASDPRHHLGKNVVGMSSAGFSQFCEMPGFAAIGDENLVKQFADIVRQEYMAIGIREALHPQIDLATEPRWARISGNFSEDAQLTARLVKPYIMGLQTSDLISGVACMTKHFPGGGPQKEGLDPHFAFQKGQIYPGNNFDYHLIPFEAAFQAGTAAIMPYYGVPTDQTNENVGMSYNKTIITQLLREKYKFDGVVCTDWGLISDVPMGPGVVWDARAWGVEKLSPAERVYKIIDAGCDQFGGENKPELVVQLVTEGKLSEGRINESMRRLLRQKFELGLFDQPFVDDKNVPLVIGRPEAKALGEKTQKISMTLLKNDKATLPLKKQKHKVYIENIDSATVAQYASVVTSPKEADFAIIRIHTPWYPIETKIPFAASFHHGDLDFKGKEKNKILDLLKTVPTIVDIYLDRPAVIPEIASGAAALIADYGASDKAVCEVLFGNAQPQGKLPFELPSSMEAVKNQKTDVPYDSVNPLFKFGFGLSYK